MVQLAVRGPALQLPPDALQLRPSHAGQPLSREVQAKMEALFKSDFSDVRVHVGPEAPAVGAIAFTHGSQLYFAPGQYAPGTAAGQRLLAHELTHVLQQRAGRVRNPFGSGIAVVQDAGLEAEAERMTVLLDRLPTPGPTLAPRLPAPPLRPPALQRSPQPQPPPRLAAPPVRLPPPPLPRPGMPAPHRPVATHVAAAVSSIQPKYAPAALRRPTPGLGLAVQCAEEKSLNRRGITSRPLALAYISEKKPGWQSIATLWNTVHPSDLIDAPALTPEVEEPKEKKKRKRKSKKKVESSAESSGEVQEKDQHKKRKKRGSAPRQQAPKTGYNWDHIFTHTVKDVSGKKTHGVFYKDGKDLQDLVEAAKLIILSGADNPNVKKVQREGSPAYKVFMDEDVGYFPGKGGKRDKVTKVIRLYFKPFPNFVEDAYPEPQF